MELAGALAVLIKTTLRSEFRRIDPLSARIVLVDMAPRVLGSFEEDLSSASKRRLERLGVEVLLGHAVDRIDDEGVIVAGQPDCEQDGDLDGWCGPIPCRKVVGGGDGSCGTGQGAG